VAQYISSAIISPPIDPNAENANVQKGLYLGLPLMIFWFSLNLPSGLSLYYFTNTVLTSAQQIWLRKLGGAQLAEYDLGEVGLGQARRSGVAATAASSTASTSAGSTSDEAGDAEEAGGLGAAPALAAAAEPVVAAPALRPLDRRCKRKKVDVAA
jgi:YidC/Oxa1 family membrane protein insertase